MGTVLVTPNELPGEGIARICTELKVALKFKLGEVLSRYTDLG